MSSNPATSASRGPCRPTSLLRAYERGRAFMPPLMIGVWDAETRLFSATRHAPSDGPSRSKAQFCMEFPTGTEPRAASD